MQASEPVSVAVGFDPDAMFRRILVPVEFNEASRCAVAEALGLQRHFGSVVHLFRLAELDEVSRFLAGTGADGITSQSLVEDAEERLERFVENVFPGHLEDVTVHAAMGTDVAEGIVEEARRLRATMVVVGAAPGHHLFRTGIETMVERMPCPVLLVRAHALH
jgi:nucleotide-binding universal stress UspA family protein